jgi:hypothetical protein
MRKLAIVVVVGGALATGCKDNPRSADTSSAAKPADDVKGPRAAGGPQAGAMSSPECTDYTATVKKVVACDKTPQAERDVIQKEYDQQAAEWANAPADAKAVTQACASSAKMLRMQADPSCGL